MVDFIAIQDVGPSPGIFWSSHHHSTSFHTFLSVFLVLLESFAGRTFGQELAGVYRNIWQKYVKEGPNPEHR
jgi:hypothetical protein